MLERLNTLWFGKSLGYIERLSIASARRQGHEVTVWSYEPRSLGGVPAGVEIRDAREVMSDERRVKLFEGKFKALGSDFFRYEVCAKRLGYWVDLDLIFLRPLDFSTPYVFGWERSGSINGAVLKLPAGSPILEELRNLPEKNWRPPFFGPKRILFYYWSRFTRGEVKLEDLPWGAAGPAMITYLAGRYDLLRFVQPQTVFYPLPYDRARDVYADAAVIRSLLSSETRTIHIWNSRLGELAKQPPPAGSYMAEVCLEHGVDCG